MVRFPPKIITQLVKLKLKQAQSSSSRGSNLGPMEREIMLLSSHRLATPITSEELWGLLNRWDAVGKELGDRSLMPHKVKHEFRRHRRAMASFALRRLAAVSRSAAAAVDAAARPLLLVLG